MVGGSKRFWTSEEGGCQKKFRHLKRGGQTKFYPFEEEPKMFLRASRAFIEKKTICKHCVFKV